MRLKLEMSRAHIPFRTLKKVYKLNDSSDVHRFTSIRQIINPLNANPTNGQTHPNNSRAASDEFFECVWPFCVVGA